MLKQIKYLFILLLIQSCIISKEERFLKNSTKEWRKSEIVLQAWLDTPFSGVFLTLRENGKFEHTSSGLWQFFEAGSWNFSNDTLKLDYENNQQLPINKKFLLFDRTSSSLKFEGDSTIHNVIFRIVKNSIN